MVTELLYILGKSIHFHFPVIELLKSVQHCMEFNIPIKHKLDPKKYLYLPSILFALSQLVGAAFGAAGQRCMALSTAIFVGETKEWIPEIVEKAKKLQVNAGN